MRGEEYRVKFPGKCDNSAEQETLFFQAMQEATGRPIYSYWSMRDGSHPPTLVHSKDPVTGNLFWENNPYDRDGSNRVSEIWRRASFDAGDIAGFVGSRAVAPVVDVQLPQAS